MLVGDNGTAASDNLALTAVGNGRWIGHDIEIFNRGSTVTLGLTTGTVMFANTITLHRDIVLAGPADGTGCATPKRGSGTWRRCATA